jgi:hypothetical protein
MERYPKYERAKHTELLLGGRRVWNLRRVYYMALDLTTPENQAELAKLIQSETDKVRTKYSTEMKKLQDQLTQLQLQSMNSTQKAEFELKTKMDEITRKEAELNKKMLDLDTKELVSSKGLKPELAILLTADTIEGRKAQLEVLVKTMNLEVKEEIIKKVGQDDPQQSNVKKDGAKGYDWNKMSYAEKVELYQKDQKLYETVRNAAQK